MTDVVHISMRRMTACGLLLAACLLASMSGRVNANDQPATDHRQVFAERAKLVEAFEKQGAEAVPLLTDALKHEADLIRRTAAHLLVRLGEPAHPALVQALENSDWRVRRIAIDAMAERGLLKDHWIRVLLDEHHSIRADIHPLYTAGSPLPDPASLIGQMADAYDRASPSLRAHIIGVIATMPSLPPEAQKLLARAVRDESAEVREAGFRTLLVQADPTWPGMAELIESAVKDESEAIRELGWQLRWRLTEVRGVDFPTAGWRFRTDPLDIGRDERWFNTDHDDAAWRTDIRILSSWNRYLRPDYIGVGWYRRTINLPQPKTWDTAFIEFEGVDEMAWVWINGQFAGEHDIGSAGWDKTFRIDVTKLVRPGQNNQFTIRAKNTRGGGGIWKPVHIRFLDSTKLTPR